MIPEPVTPPERDAGLRRQTAFDLEVTLVGFLTKLFAGQRLDNPTLNLAQATAPEPHIVRDPDEPPVSYDPAERMQTLALKQPPRVMRGRVPRTVTGEIALDKLPDVPNIIVQAIKAKVEQPSTIVTVRILFSTYDENPDSSGYQDCLNLIEAAAMALTSFGQQAIDQAYPIQLPLEWTLVEPDCFPHFVGEMTTTWELPSARPLPDETMFGLVPMEQIGLPATHSSSEYPPPPEQPTPPTPPTVNLQAANVNFAGSATVNGDYFEQVLGGRYAQQGGGCFMERRENHPVFGITSWIIYKGNSFYYIADDALRPWNANWQADNAGVEPVPTVRQIT